MNQSIHYHKHILMQQGIYYQVRINQAIAYLNAHLSEPLDINQVATAIGAIFVAGKRVHIEARRTYSKILIYETVLVQIQIVITSRIDR